MAKDKNRISQGLKLEIKVIPPQYLDLTLGEIISHLGDGPLLWPGGAGRAQGVKFTPYEIKKKRGRKPKATGSTSLPKAAGASGKSLP
jgi:hypothetical protein